MANWSGTYTISAGTTGTFTAGNNATTLNNTSASWPTGAQSLANFTVRFLSGAAAGQTAVITSNTATVLTVPALATVPATGDVYEIVAMLRNGDHITANTTFSTNVITELQDSATVYIDGSYTLLLNGACTVRWAKSISTLVTFQPNNRATQGKAGFWQHIGFNNLSIPPEYSYIKVVDAIRLIVIAWASGTGNLSNVHHLWGENLTGGFSNSGSPNVDITLRDIFMRYGPGSYLRASSFSMTSNRFTFLRCWLEDMQAAGVLWAANVQNQDFNACVLQHCRVNNLVNLAAGCTGRIFDGYFGVGRSGVGNGILIGANTIAAAGTYRLQRCVTQEPRAVYGNSNSTATVASSFNDFVAYPGEDYPAIDIQSAANYTAATSDNDYMSGNALAAPENVDTTMAATSTASPVQYKNLTTARTNAKSTRNRPLTVDNIVTGAQVGDTVTVTFDSANGAVSGQGLTTINSDSASGQPVLNVASSTGFEAGETIEIGYGTARFETGVVSSVGAGTVTITSNLTHTHTAGQADVVAKTLRNQGLAFVRFGTTSGIYTQATIRPSDHNDWGLIYTGLRTTFNGITFAWLQRGHSVTLQGLEPSTTYYYQPGAYTPLGEVMTGAEQSFTTAASSLFSDPGVDNVLNGVSYKFNSATDNRTGTYIGPVTGNVKIGVSYGPAAAYTGTYDGADRWTDPGIANVRLGIAYKANSTTANRTGNVTIPTVGDVRFGVTYDSLLSLTGTYAALTGNDVLEGSLTVTQALRLILAASAGKVSGAAGTTVVIRDTTDSKDRITATVDQSGNRTAISYDVS